MDKKAPNMIYLFSELTDILNNLGDYSVNSRAIWRTINTDSIPICTGNSVENTLNSRALLLEIRVKV